jgi:hypothetical protein
MAFPHFGRLIVGTIEAFGADRFDGGESFLCYVFSLPAVLLWHFYLSSFISGEFC